MPDGYPSRHRSPKLPKNHMSDQAQHTETFRATAEGKGWPTTVQITDTEWTIQLDEPTDDGGENSGPNPMQFFAASLAGCQNEQAQVVAEELGVSIQGIEIDLEIDLDLAGFMGMAEHSDGSYKQARLAAVVRGDLTAEQVNEMGQRVDRRCPILALLRSSGCDIVSSWSVA
ncbi:MAG: putative redox protein [Planctomycetota bacterium]|jgi:putative redox protein